METQAQPINPDSDLDGMNAEQLEAELAKCLGLTERTIYRAAKITVRLIQMGREPQLKWRRWLQSIGSGLLHEKTFIKFFTNKPLLKKLEYVPRQYQLAIANGERVPLAIIVEGEIKESSKIVSDMSREEIARAFSGKAYNDGIRPFKEQKKLLEKPLQRAIKAKNKSFFVDPKSKCIKHSSAFIRDSDGEKVSAVDMLNALSEYHEVDLEAYIIKHAEELK